MKAEPRTLPPPPWADEPPVEMDATARRSVALGFDFLRAVAVDPDILDDVPNGAVVALIPVDDSEVADLEIVQGMAMVRAGADVYFRHVRPSDRVSGRGEP